MKIFKTGIAMLVLRGVLFLAIFILVAQVPVPDSYKIKYYVTNSVVLFFQLVIVIASRYVKNAFLDYAIPAWLVLQYVSIDPTTVITMTSYVYA